MASMIKTCEVTLDAEATRIAETVAAMLTAQGRTADLDAIVSNAVRIAYGKPLGELVNAADANAGGLASGRYGMP